MSWSPDWRLLFPVTEASESPATQEKCALWAVRVEPHNAEAAGKPERLAQTGDFAPGDLAVSADGKRLSFLKTRMWQDVYLGELSPDRAGMKAPRRFTLDNRGRGSWPNSWTADSQAIFFSSNRNGKWEIFRQGLNENIAEAVIEGPGDDWGAQFSPDGSWLMYEESAHTAPGAPPSPERLMRRPVAGGSPEMVLEEPGDMDWDYRCPLKFGSLCVLGEKQGKQIVLYSLDPVRGKGSELGNIHQVFEHAFWALATSPDGSRLAFVGENKHEERIEVLTLSDRAWHEIPLEPGWGALQSVAWAADGKRFFVTSWLPDSFNLLHVTLDGKVKPLLRNGRRQWMHGPLPSPGKYLAFQGQTWDSNVWMLEGF